MHMLSSRRRRVLICGDQKSCVDLPCTEQGVEFQLETERCGADLMHGMFALPLSIIDQGRGGDLVIIIEIC
jgi:hypothetical protein